MTLTPGTLREDSSRLRSCSARYNQALAIQTFSNGNEILGFDLAQVEAIQDQQSSSFNLLVSAILKASRRTFLGTFCS
jgi:uncharacterized protein YfdQ (DUF2303 family)